MGRLDPDGLPDFKLVRVFVASTLADARRAEGLLEAQGVDYVVTVEALGYTLFGSPRNAAVFAVREGQAAYCAAMLIGAGLEFGVLGQDW